MATITKIKWDDADFKWNTAPPSEDYKSGFKPSTFPYTWDDVSLVEELLKGPPGELWDEWDEEKKKRIIKLICKVQGRTYKETKEIKDIKISAKDIKILAEKVLGIEVLTENIKF
tara:strand:+ start:1236 stop:1580 length:345 start_codon:yes stop_codon:yes gene_type:complete